MDAKVLRWQKPLFRGRIAGFVVISCNQGISVARMASAAIPAPFQFGMKYPAK
jgi:hypothetical protein